MKSIIKPKIRLLIVLFIVAVILFSAGLYFFQKENNAPAWPNEDPSIQGVSFTEHGVHVSIQRGESLSSLSSRLQEAGLIRSSLLWKFFSRVLKESPKYGDYLITESLSSLELYRLLSSGKVVLRRITIPEGLTVGKMAQRFESAQFTTKEDFLAAVSNPDLLKKYNIPADSLEGYLFPETYHFPSAYPAQRIVDDMLALFFRTLDSIYPSHREEDPMERHRKVILASIVEREAYLQEEAPLIAGVFYNRLRIQMPLQSCATVEYIITEVHGRPHPTRLYDVDIAIRHPYNTYINPGLPPGPIANPGATALRAVYAPKDSDYLFFRLIDPNSGEHAFSKTYDQHLEYTLLFNQRNRSR